MYMQELEDFSNSIEGLSLRVGCWEDVCSTLEC